jgi:hypothetical protein
MPWEETEQYIRSGHRNPDDFQSDSLRTITISEEEGIKAVIGKPKGKDTTEVQSYLFDKSKSWTVDKAKAWFEKHQPVKEHVSAILPFKVLEKLVDKPLKIRGVAMTTGMSRNFNIYTPEELQAFASKLVSAPVYVEHVSVENAVGKVTKTEWDGQSLWYEAEIYDDETAEKIRKGLVQHVSVGADYEAIDVVDGKIPHGLHDAELSLVAVPGIPETNVQILEKLAREQVDPLVAGEYFLGFYQDPALFLPEHFRTVWLDQANGVLAVMAKSRANPAKESCQSILFLKSKWQPNTVTDWLTIHPDYSIPASTSVSPGALSGVESLKEEELKELIKSGVAEALKVHEQEDKDKQAQIERSQKYGIGIKQGGNVTKPGEFANIPEDQFADPVNFRYPVDAEHCKAALGYFNQPDNRSQYSQEEQNKIMQKIVAACVSNGVEVSWQPNDPAYKALPEELKAKCTGYTKESSDAEKLAAAEKKLADTTSKLTEAEKTIEQLRKQLPGGGLIKDLPKIMQVSEAVGILEGLLPSPVVENSTMGMKRECQAIRGAIHKLRERMKTGTE